MIIKLILPDVQHLMEGGPWQCCASGLILFIKQSVIKTLPYAHLKRGRESSGVVRQLWWTTRPCRHTCTRLQQRREYCSQIQGARLMAPVSKMQTVWPWGRLAAEVWSVTQIRVSGDVPPVKTQTGSHIMTNLAHLALYHTFICRVWGVCIFRAVSGCISGHASWNHAMHGRARGCRSAPVGTAARSGHVNPNLSLEREQLVSSCTSSGHGGAPAPAPAWGGGTGGLWHQSSVTCH